MEHTTEYLVGSLRVIHIIMGNFFDFFQKGDSITWIGNLAITAIGSFIGILGSLVIFNRTILNEHHKEVSNSLNQQRERIQYFRMLITATRTKVKDQLQYIDTYCENLKSQPHAISLIEYVSFNDLHRLVHIINQESYFHTYLKEFGGDDDSIKEIREIYFHLDYLDSQLKIVCDPARANRKLFNDFSVECNDKIKEIIEKALFIVYTKPPEFSSEIIGIINNILTKYHENGKKNISYGIENLIEPLLINLHHFAKSDPIIVPFLNELKRPFDIYNQLKALNDDTAKTYSEISTELEGSLNQLNKATNRLDKWKPAR